MKKKQKGFTLIELLVSISIIAILTALLTVNFVGARQRGRDGKRKSEVYQLQSALELYRSDNGSYPIASTLNTCNTAFTYNSVSYMAKIPCDPSPNSAYTNPLSSDMAYTYTPSPLNCDNSSSNLCTTYTLTACIENAQDSQADSSKNGSCTTASFTLTNP